MQAKPPTVRLKPHKRFLFKPIDHSATGGCHIDVYLPAATRNAPVAMMIHGGAWTIGGSDHLPPDQVNFLLARGFAVVSPEYRLLPHVKLDEAVDDLVDAYRWTLNDLCTATQTELDANSTCIMGWSAGGTGTLLLTHRILQAGLQAPKAIIATYPKTDNERGWSAPMSAYKKGISDEEKKQIEPLFSQPVSTDVNIGPGLFQFQTPRMAWARATMRTKTLNTWLCGCDSPYPTDLSPIHVVSEQFPPLMLVIATGDTLIEPSESYDLASKMKEAGGKVQYLEAVGMTHGLAEDGKETWPEGQNWWQEAILPSLTWVVEAVQQQQLTVYRVKVK